MQNHAISNKQFPQWEHIIKSISNAPKYITEFFKTIQNSQYFTNTNKSQ